MLWRGLTEVVEKYIRKGSLVSIEGKIRSRSWDDKEGNKRYITEIVGDTLTILGSKKDDSSAAQNHENASKNAEPSLAPAQESTDDLPF